MSDKKNEVKIKHIVRNGVAFQVIINKEANLIVAKTTTNPQVCGFRRSKKGVPTLDILFKGWQNDLIFKATARCADDDTWNESFGIDLAIQRCWRKMCYFMIQAINLARKNLSDLDKKMCKIKEEEVLGWGRCRYLDTKDPTTLLK